MEANVGAADPIISIGVLAHNEALRIGDTLKSLFAQDIFELYSVELVIVANGCTDNTVAIARECLQEHHAIWSDQGFARVEELIIPGKSNAWNHFVHYLSARSAKALVLMDADIELLRPGSISTMFAALLKNPEAVVSVDRPIKDIQALRRPTLFQRLLLVATPEIASDHIPLCGQLYCALSTELRLIELPTEISCEDGFLRALLLTKGFTCREKPSRIILESQAAHSFASVASLSELFRHEKWIVAGSIVNMLLFERFSAEARPHCNAMDLMKLWAMRDPSWVASYARARAQEKGWRSLPSNWWLRRWLRLRRLSARQQIRRLPIAIVATAADAVIFIAAIRDVRNGKAFQYWNKNSRRV